MPTLRVFISHSAHGDDLATAVRDELEASLREEGFHTFVDSSQLEHGKPWRERVNTYLTRCDAAVVLITAKAAESKFVAYEVAILSHRRNRHPNFCLIPLFLPGVSFNDLKTSGLGPAQIDELHPYFVRHENIQSTIQQVKDHLADAAALQVPLDDQVQKLITLLGKVEAGKIEKAAEQLNVDLGPFDPVEDAIHSLALKLLSSGIETATSVIQTLKGNWDADELEILFKIIACSWVDPRSTDRIPMIARGDRQKRNIALNTEYPPLAELHVLRASRRPPDVTGLEAKGWEVANVNNVKGEADLASDEALMDEFIAEVEAELRNVLGTEEGENLDDYLRVWDSQGLPVFAAMRFHSFPDKVLQKLRATFGSVTYFFLTGSDISDPSVFESAGVERILPELHAEDAHYFHSQYQDQWLLVKAKKSRKR